MSSSAAEGIAIYGNGGMNTDYATRDTPFGAGVYGGDHTGVDYGQVFANLNYSRRFADNKASWGLAAIINYSFFKNEWLK
jgi:long-chain fatty acid transport protein